ncbi:DUF5694 domain-containing protein [uncultured Alistipes sp.]|jgi:hypothetical protein|uniref:DUF5694 domain-containing protein n=1 Tax=uncultured Alistipes sp. TaxID=538949 RepID=UPI0025E86304|nr:DUF5694 domain-containing protein [uncultured Alistipes sp.]
MKKVFIPLFFSFFAHWGNAQTAEYKTKFDDAVPVLNVGTFHMGYSPDASTVEFDEHAAENVRQIHQIAKMIAEFKPTILVVELDPAKQEMLEKQYREYLDNPEMEFENPNEIQLLVFEVGRLCGAERTYGINYAEEYNYNIYNSLKDKIDTRTLPKYMQMMESNQAYLAREFFKNPMAPTVLEMIKSTNHPAYQDFLININADLLTYVSTKGNAEGAEQAARFYHRNLVMFSNLNQIELSKDDRVFILMGGVHSAFFSEWLKRSPKYMPVDVFEYLK